MAKLLRGLLWMALIVGGIFYIAWSQLVLVLLMSDVALAGELQHLQLGEATTKRLHDDSVSRGGGRTVIAEVTAYSCGIESTGKSAGHPAYCITASGRRLSDDDSYRVVAADTRFYPIGTHIHINGVGIAVVADTGGAIKGADRFDLFVGKTDVTAAINWGRQLRKITILGVGQ